MTLLFLLKHIGGPGSIGFLACGCAAGLCLIYLWPRHRTVGRVSLLALYSFYIVLGLPVVAHTIAAPMADSFAGHRSVAAGIDTLVVFGGDNVMGRVREAGRIWSAAPPTTVIASGDLELVEHLLKAGIPRQRLIQDESSATTREQVEYVRAYLAMQSHARVAVVASRLQMPRVVALMQRAAVPVTFYAAPVDSEPADHGIRLFVPTYAALNMSRDALYERAAVAYYRWEGWIDGL